MSVKEDIAGIKVHLENLEKKQDQMIAMLSDRIPIWEEAAGNARLLMKLSWLVIAAIIGLGTAMIKQAIGK